MTETTSIITDTELISLIRSQPTQGMAMLYDRYGRLVFSIALRVVQDHGVAEEITQDVFLRCWRMIDSYHSEQGSLITWLASITRNRAVDELRSRRGKAVQREVSDQQISHFLIDAGYDEALLRDAIRQALVELPAAQREVIELAFWGGLTRREVGEKLGVPLGTVHTRLRLALDKLRETLRDWVHTEQTP